MRERVYGQIIDQNLIRGRAQQRGNFFIDAFDLKHLFGGRSRAVAGRNRDDGGSFGVSNEKNAVRSERKGAGGF